MRAGDASGRIADCGLRLADCGLWRAYCRLQMGDCGMIWLSISIWSPRLNKLLNPQSAIRNPQSEQFLLRRLDAFQPQIDRRLGAVMGLMREAFVQGDGARHLESAEEFDWLVHLLHVHAFDRVDDEIVTL